MSFPRYPEYRNSGVKWLGDVPNNWPVYRVKQTTYLKGRVGWKGLTSDEYLEYGDAYLVTGTDFSGKFIDWSGCHHVDISRYEDDPYIQLKDGDLLITKDGTIGKLALVRNLDKPACLNSGIFLVRPLKAYTTRYMYWVLSSTAFSVFCDLSSTGSTIQHLYQNVFENFVFPAPSLLEQNAISDFLDHETAKIDALVAEQEKLIALLKEKRQAVISHAVTKGLNPDAPMKDSGIEWLGKVPAHWEVIALKHLVSRPIIDGPHETPVKRSEGIPFVSAESVSQGFIDFDKIWGYISPEDHAQYSKRYKPRRGDILLVKLGATTGTPAIVETDTDFNIWVPLAAIRLNTEMEPRFVLHTLESDSLRTAYELGWTYGTQQTLGLRTISNLRIPVPPREEQREIWNYLGSLVPMFESLAAETQRAITLLQERRAALISAAVTGKIDVRGLSTKKEAA